MTPQEWRELDPRDAAFLANAFGYSNKVQRQHYQQAKNKMKRGR